MGIAPKPIKQLSPSPRASDGLTDAYTDILGGEPLQSNMSGMQTDLNFSGINAQLTVVAGGPTGKRVIVPEIWFGGNVTWVRGLFSVVDGACVPRYSDFMADFTGTDTTNYADFGHPASNNYDGTVLTTDIPVLSTVAIGTVLQAYYSYRDGTFSKKGEAMSGYPSLHVDLYQGTANDGDNYIMLALYHAYHITQDEKFKNLADRMGKALIAAGSWDSNTFSFEIPFSAIDGQVGFYSYNAPTTPFLVDYDSFGLNIKTQVDSGGPPYNFSGFGLWPTIPVTSFSQFQSLDIEMIGDGSGRALEVNVNIDPAKSSAGDYFCLINMIPQDGYSAVLFSLKAADFWKTDNVLYDSGHKDYSYYGTYGSDVNVIQDQIDITRKRVIKKFVYNFSGNDVGYAGMYFGAPEASSLGKTGLRMSLNAAHDGVGTFTVQDAADVNHVIYVFFKRGLNEYNIPWVGTIPPDLIQVYIDPTGQRVINYDPLLQPEYAGLYFGPDQVGFCQDSSIVHPIQQVYFDAIYKIFSLYPGIILALQSKGLPLTHIPFSPGSFYLTGSDNNSIYFDKISYDDIVTMESETPTVFNGLQISFPSNDLGREYNVTFVNMGYKMGIQDGPLSDPQRYQGLTRWTYKWKEANGFIGYGSWRGQSAVGYHWAAGWFYSGLTSYLNNRKMSDMMLDFFEDAQNKYEEWFPSSTPGPFVPRYGRPSWEHLTAPGYVDGVYESSTYNKWYYPETDDWYGYMVRALLAVAQLYFAGRSSRAKAILDKWMAWFELHILPDGAYWKPPSEYFNNGNLGYSYKPLYAYVCMAQACIFKYWVDGDPIALKWYRRLLDDIYDRQRLTETGSLAGIYPVAEGMNYTSATVSFTVNSGAIAPTCTPFISGGKITHYDIIAKGSGITSISCSIIGDGTGAVGNAYLTDDLVGGFSDSHAGWELSELINTYALLVVGGRPPGVISYPLTPSAEDQLAYDGLLDFYKRTARDTRPSNATSHYMPMHEYRVDPYHNGAGIENPMRKDTHVKGAMWTETIGPTIITAVDYGVYTGDYSWLEALYSLILEFTGNIGDKMLTVFPTLAGLSWDIKTSPTFNTIIHRAASGYEVRAALMQYPLWQFSLSYNFLRDDSTNELKTLMGFFLARQGSYNAFLYENPNDHSVVDQGIGSGNGTATVFQLYRSYGGFVEPVNNVKGTPVISVAGVIKTSGTHYTIDSTGVITFVTPPGAGQLVSWTGEFYYRVRFLADKADYNQFMFQLFELKQLEFIGSTTNKV